MVNRGSSRPVSMIRKRKRLIQSDRCVNNNVVDISSSDDETVVALTHKKNVDDHIEKDETMNITSMCLTILFKTINFEDDNA
ncbi:hypothetical protein Tco_0905060 [Tanacetum coccineum]